MPNIAYIMEQDEGPVLMRPTELKLLLGNVSDQWLWRNRHDIPRPVLIADRKFYVKNEVTEYLRSRIAERDSGANEPGPERMDLALKGSRAAKAARVARSKAKASIAARSAKSHQQ